MAESAVPVPSIWELDYCDLTLYQHPPCMFTLWYLGLAVNAVWDPIKDLVDRIVECLGGDGGGGGGGGGSSSGDEKKEDGGEAKEGDDGGKEEQEEGQEEGGEEETQEGEGEEEG